MMRKHLLGIRERAEDRSIHPPPASAAMPSLP
jgi:hypothetical protein